jgi:hypothetical protein
MGFDQWTLVNPETSPYNPLPIDSNIPCHPLLVFVLIPFFAKRENFFQQTHDKAQYPKGQDCASHAHNKHRNAKCPIV